MLLFPTAAGKKPYWVELGNMERPRAWYPAVAVLGNRLMVASGKVKYTICKLVGKY